MGGEVLVGHTDSRANLLRQSALTSDGCVVGLRPGHDPVWRPSPANGALATCSRKYPQNGSWRLTIPVLAKARTLLCCHTISVPVQALTRPGQGLPGPPPYGRRFPRFLGAENRNGRDREPVLPGTAPVAPTAPRKSNLSALRANVTTVRANGGNRRALCRRRPAPTAPAHVSRSTHGPGHNAEEYGGVSWCSVLNALLCPDSDEKPHRHASYQQVRNSPWTKRGARNGGAGLQGPFRIAFHPINARYSSLSVILSGPLFGCGSQLTLAKGRTLATSARKRHAARSITPLEGMTL